MMDFDRAAKVSGSRFVYLTKGLARMERALAGFMLDLHTDTFGYTEVVPPILARDEAFFGTAQLPKFEIDQFWTGDSVCEVGAVLAQTCGNREDCRQCVRGAQTATASSPPPKCR